MAGEERIARDEGRQVDLVHMIRFHEHRMVVALTPPNPERLPVEVEGPSIGVDVDEGHHEVRVFDVGREVDRDRNRAGHLDR